MNRLLLIVTTLFLAFSPTSGRAEEPAHLVRESPSGGLRFHSAPNSVPLAEMLARTGDEDRAWVARDVGADYPGITDVYVTIDEVSFLARQAPDPLAPSWASGVAYPKRNKIVLKIGAKETNPRALLRHELSHISLGLLTEDRAPRWLLEGIAMVHAGNSWNTEGPSLMKAVLSDNLFPFQRLAFGFPSAPSDAELAYAQSAHFVNYLVERFGEERLEDVLRRMVSGQSFDNAVSDVTGLSPVQLENQWRRSLSRWEMLFRLASSYEFLFGVLTLLVAFAWWKRRHDKRLQLMLLEREEQAEAMRALLREPAVWADQPMTEEPVPSEAPETDGEDDATQWELSEDDLPDELFARREQPPPKKPTLH